MVGDPDLRSAISSDLQSGEKVLWIGKPTPIRVVMHYAESLLPGIVAMVALVVILTIFSSTHIFSFELLGLGFSFQWIVLIFLLLVFYYFARPVYEYWRALRTIYAVTDRRALIVKPDLNGKQVLSYPKIERIERQNLADGKGDLVFGSETYSTRGRYGYRVRTRKIGFFGIDNAQQVETLMLNTFVSSMYPDFDDL